MASEHFDNLARFCAFDSSRRMFIARFAGSLIPALPLALGGENAAGKKKRKRKKRCNCAICQRCLGSRCIPAPDGIPCRDCGRCFVGVCAIPLGKAETACGPCATCGNGGVCVPRAEANNTQCNGDGRCLNGTCNPEPTCAGADEPCLAFPPCCSGQCCQPGPFEVCCPSGESEPCYDDFDCVPGHGCIGYRCLPGG